MLTACPICEHYEYWLIPFNKASVPVGHSKVSNYQWRLCKNCGSGYPSPPPSLGELQLYWDLNRIENGREAITDEVWKLRLLQDKVWAERTFQFIEPHVAENQRYYLDVACGLGASVKYFETHGWISEGVDADPNVKEFHLKLGIKSIIGQIESVETARSFDLISISHAIYFITNPRAFVARVKNILNINGLFLVVLSDFMSSLSSGQPGFAHTWYPALNPLTYLLRQEGFELVDIRRIRGSILILARNTAASVSKPRARGPYREYLKHLTQRLRYRLFGTSILRTASLARWVHTKVKSKYPV